MIFSIERWTNFLISDIYGIFRNVLSLSLIKRELWISFRSLLDFHIFCAPKFSLRFRRIFAKSWFERSHLDDFRCQEVLNEIHHIKNSFFFLSCSHKNNKDTHAIKKNLFFSFWFLLVQFYIQICIRKYNTKKKSSLNIYFYKLFLL